MLHATYNHTHYILLCITLIPYSLVTLVRMPSQAFLKDNLMDMSISSCCELNLCKVYIYLEVTVMLHVCVCIFVCDCRWLSDNQIEDIHLKAFSGVSQLEEL